MDTAAGNSLKADFHRPRYHFLPAANWMNDPNGVIHWNGVHHLFFQYNPDGAYHANMHWGHALSDDLIHWRELPAAIAPTPHSPDQGGVFSGCMVDDHGKPTAIYTGVNDDYTVQTQCLARGNHDLTRWEKHDGNPVIDAVPPELGQTRDFRDPFVWRGDDCWYMVLASRIVGVGGAVLLYRSDDLLRWEYLHPLFVGERARNGFNFECPNFFPLGDKWVLIISMQPEAHFTGVTLYFVGRLENCRFIPEQEGVYDAGYSYASLCSSDQQGRRLIHSWIREGRHVDLQRAAGWSGVQAIPRVLSLDARNRLVSLPVPELETLRGRQYHFDATALADAALPVSGLSLDIEAEFDVNLGETCGLGLTASADGRDKVSIVYERQSQILQVRRQYADDSPERDSDAQGIPHRLDPEENLVLRILLDGSVVEVIANGRSRITSRFYPSSLDKPCLRVLSPAAVVRLDAWQLSSIG